MEIRRTVSVEAVTSDNQVMEVGKTYIYDTRVGCFVGIYRGLTSHKTLIFDGMFGKDEATFRVAPSSIFTIYEAAAELNIHDESEVRE